MPSKFSKRAPFDRLLSVVGVLLCMASPLFAQQPSPASSAQPTYGYVRFWNMLTGKTAPTLELLLSEDKSLTTAQPLNVTANYSPLAPATYTFIVRKSGDKASVLRKQPVVLRATTYITFLVTEKNGQPVVDLIDDTLDPKKAADPALLLIRQFIPAAKVSVSTREGAKSQEVGFGETATLDNLPNRNLYLTIKATGLGPEPRIWNTDVDYTTARHATILAVSDAYGRFRPRIVYDGQMGSAPDPTPTPTPSPKS